MAKTHYANCERGNECNPRDEWGTTACGLTECESPMTDNLEYTTCIKCIDIVTNYRERMKNKAKKTNHT